MKKKELQILQTIKPVIQESFDNTREKIKNIFAEGKEEIINIINDEINNISDRLKEANKDIDVATEKLKHKINAVIEKIKIKQKEVFTKLVKEIEKKIHKKLEEKEIKLSASNIDTNKGLTIKMLISIIVSTIAGVGIMTGLSFIGENILTGAAADEATSTFGAAAAGADVGPIGIAF